MRCLACEAEMKLVKVVVEDTMIEGFESHIFMCTSCKDIERRLVFNNQSKRTDSEIVSHPIAPYFSTFNNPDVEHIDTASTSLGAGSNNHRSTTHSFWGRLIAKIRSN